MRLSLLLCALVGVSAHGDHGLRRRATPPALQPMGNVNSLPTNGGPTLYYNGTGPVPGYNATSPLPEPITPIRNCNKVSNDTFNQIVAISAPGSIFNTTCEQCVAQTQVLHMYAMLRSPEKFTELIIAVCQQFKWKTSAPTCALEYGSNPGGQIGYYWAEIYSKFNMGTGDMTAWCWNQFSACPVPPVIQIDESQFFTPKPASAMIAPPPSGKTIEVLHISDAHLDPRYDVGSEGNCSQNLCCRAQNTNTALYTNQFNASSPASRFGNFNCDSPADLFLSTFDTMDQFFDKKSIDFVIYTGDIVSHDRDDQLSRPYVEYSEKVVYESFKAQMGNVPIYGTLGNHDSYPQASNQPNGYEPDGVNAYSWNYELLSGLWKDYGWITDAEAQLAATHYAAFAHTTSSGLRIISFNADFYYHSNFYNYVNYTNPDTTGMFKWIANELAACEAKGQRAWLIAHVLSGYDGTNALQNPSALFQTIVNRFSPATIAGVFFGHTHEDQIQIFYDYASGSLNGTMRNTTMINYAAPLQLGWIGPSITPLTGLNAGYQKYTVDAQTFSIMEVSTYFANISNALTWTTPVWQYEYDMRSTYNVNNTWPATSPINATFWDRITYSMLSNESLVQTYNKYETKSSSVGKNCTSNACAVQKVCYIRSGSAAVGMKCGKSNGPN